MKTSVKLANMEKHFNDILTLINDNQQIKRLLKDLTDNPLDPSKPDIEQSLIGDNIQLSFFNEKIVTSEKCFLFFNLLNSDLQRDPIGEEIYLLDIIVPTSKWVLRGLGQFRAIRIAMQLCEMLDQQAITGISEIKINKAQCYKLNEEFQGCSLTMSVGTSNMKKLR